MAKTKTPFFSLGSRGTLGDALTTQKRGRDTIVREKPIPRDPYSLNQAYQRWDYRDYAYLWTLLSNSEKQIYRTKASRYHITGFSQWMRENLKDLTGLVARWHLDEKSGATAYDSSRNNNNAIIYGASPVAGRIAGAYSFDGLNDWLNAGHDPSLDLTSQGTIELSVYIPSHVAEYYSLIQKGTGGGWTSGRYFIFYHHVSGVFYGCIRDAVAVSAATFPAVSFGTWHRLAFTWDGSWLIAYVDGIPGTPVVQIRNATIDTTDLKIGRSQTNYAKTIIDEVSLYDYARPETLLLIHAGRRYPS